LTISVAAAMDLLYAHYYCCCCRDSLMRNYYYALRCFMLDFWDHKKGECSPNPKTSVQRAIYRAADTNISSSMGSRAVTDVPKCLYLVDGGRICWVQSVRGEEFATPDMQVSPGQKTKTLCYQ
jgi:hypothetical protein